MNILEAYGKKLAVAEKVYANEHGNRQLSETKKIAIARVLANTSEYLNEAFENSVGTQLANMKTFKKFCLDLTTVALPNLIANDLVIVYPMKSRTGFIQYLQFTAGSNKGGVEQGQVFNDPFRLGKMDENRVNYTAALVVDPVTEDGVFTTAWTPVVNGFRTIVVDDVEVEFNENFINRYTKEQLASVKTRTYKIIKDPKKLESGDLAVVFANSIGESGEAQVVAGDKVAYKYDNVVIPQNDLPIVNAHMEGIALAAKARRIAIYYSQMAAFQAKTEMGIDLGEILATQACAELSYEIDTEIVNLLVNAAIEGTSPEEEKAITWNKALPYGVSKRDHYAGFVEVIETASQIIYDRTQKHAANYMLAASNLKPVLALIDGWKAASTSKINGPYFAGTLNGIKVYISPAIAPGRYVLGYNGDDMTTSAAVYAPYMAIVPTQLLGFADGAMSQGFSTLYDLKLLNPLLLVAGRMENKQEIVLTKAQA